MPGYYIHMDQGLVTDLRNHNLTSGQFSSCAPIVFHNSVNHMGALYHLGGCSKLDELKVGHLNQLATMVKLTDVYVLCGTGVQPGLFNPSEEEIDASLERGEGFPKVPLNRYQLWGQTGHVAPVRTLLASDIVAVHEDFGGLKFYGSISVSVAAGALVITEGYDETNKLDNRKKIESLAGDLIFIDENNDDALAKWH